MKKIKVIDLSADFRLKSIKEYLKWYKIKHSSKNNIKNSSSSIIEIPWKIQNVESGVYLARIRAINKNSTEEKIVKVGIIK